MSEELNQDGEEFVDKSDRDEMIRKKNFSRARGIDISSFMITEENQDEPADVNITQQEPEKDIDIAMGEVAELLSKLNRSRIRIVVLNLLSG